MKKSTKILLIFLGVLSAIGIILSSVSYSNRSISIIGGADGPTSIFIAGKMGNSNSSILYVITGLSLFFLIICGVLFLKKKK